MRLVHKTRETPCNCVFRSIFRVCYNRFRECVALGDQTKAVSMDHGGGCRPGGHTYSRKREEFIADFSLVSRRVLEDSETAFSGISFSSAPTGNSAAAN